MTNMKADRGENLGFAIPINYVKDFLRNREAFAFDKDNPNTGLPLPRPPRRLRPGAAAGGRPPRRRQPGAGAGSAGELGRESP